ncbi:ciliary-associated calcium-binding coiled-coil protein 1 [Pteronotus mesoamericanus]|uniref:ciliary-associated calcium-binding coiled-coil protein 1 n=1 Tax=Pteronotus mesoamericanus TaxID=1884717 RepID=UPI0023EBE3B2|nr:ciliary-associated calcium-binding coiled-coil protein 1 [Pteronotus parnellii mesoamericanus]
MYAFSDCPLEKTQLKAEQELKLYCLRKRCTWAQGCASHKTFSTSCTWRGCLCLGRTKRDAEIQEHEEILSPDFLSVAQITELLAEDIDGVQKKLAMFLNFENLKTCLKEAILLDYYVSGFLWARGMDFSIIQYSKFMTLLDMLLHNLRTLHMSLEDSLKWLGEVMAEIGPSHLQKNEKWNIFDVKQANAVIDYLKISLFQHYKLYEFLFYSTREEIVIGTEQMIEVVKPSGGFFPNPLEEGISFDIYSMFIEPPPTLDTEMKGLDQEQGPVEPQPEASTSDTDALVGFTIEDVKSVLAQVTDDILIGIQTEINEKLQIQEEAFNARIEKLKKA